MSWADQTLSDKLVLKLLFRFVFRSVSKYKLMHDDVNMYTKQTKIKNKKKIKKVMQIKYRDGTNKLNYICKSPSESCVDFKK